MRKLLFVAVLVLCPAALLLADVVHMTDGRKIKGKIVSETEDYVLLKGKYGEVKLNRHEIDHIDYGPVEEEEESKPSKPKVKKKPKPRKTAKVDLASLVDKAAKGDAQAAKKLIAAKRAALVPINKKLKDATGEEKARLEKLRDAIEENTKTEKAKAESLFQEATKLHKQCVELGEKAGKNPTAEQQRKALELLDGATQKLVEAFELDPARTDILQAITNMGDFFYKGRRYTRAVPLFKIARNARPDNSTVSQRLASCYMNLKRYKEAKKILQEIIKKKPDNAIAWANLGSICNAEKKYDKAIEYLEKAKSLGLEDSADLFDYLGTAYKYKKKWDKAIENFEKCLEKNDKHLNALFQLGALYANKQDYEKAIEKWEKFCKLCPDTKTAKNIRKEISKLKKRAEKQKK